MHGQSDAGEDKPPRRRRIPALRLAWRRRPDDPAERRQPLPGGSEGGAPAVDPDWVTFRLADPTRALAGVRLAQQVRIPGDALDFGYAGDGWTLRVPRPPVRRMEYRFDLRYADGSREEICDPANPARAPGAFGAKSVVEFPGYAPPAWLAASRVDVPLLLAHDGPEYDALAGLTTFSAASIAAGRLPRHRVALIGPGDRDERYSANVAYARAVALAVVPALRRTVAVAGPPVGMGASLGALAMLHAQRRHSGVLGGLFLQSGSFFDRRLDPQERGFARFTRISRFVAGTLRSGLTTDPVPATLTCGVVEENLANNRRMAAALLAQGYDARLVVNPDGHNYVGWRDTFDPALLDLLATVWA